jgi:serine/threonine protein kinase
MATPAAKQLEDALFFAALHVTDFEQRGLFLDQACLDNPALREAVEQMLAVHEDADRLIDRGLDAIALTAAEIGDLPKGEDPRGMPDPQIGNRIGRYMILESLGEGGCGSVYLAEQDEPVMRLVALKIIKLGMDTRSVIARFDVERQALAMMDHPNIARVLEAGATETGRPYFVLELVRGIRITEFCDANRCDLRQRLELFIQVCKAIQHAHQKGVIHRDIKPSNVLVAEHDGVPVPKVIDFGIAKAIEGRLGDQSFHTKHEQFLGTPAYMSPEQAEMGGLDVDTRSDVYALGVLLYELLTGRTPFDPKELASVTPEEMRRILRQREPQRLSMLLRSLSPAELQAVADARRTDPSKLVSQVKGDLEWIAMKALEKDRARRYGTANGLAMEIERFLANEAIVARPPGNFYLLGKLIRRHAVFFAAGGATMLALAAGLGASTLLYFKAKRAEKKQTDLREVAELALRNEAMLRREAESREKLTEAVILLRQGNHEGAANALNSMQERPRRPSLDGVTALRSVGEWLALQGRWREASERFLWLLEIDKLDRWGPVTIDVQSCGVVLVESGDTTLFRQFCIEAIDAHASPANADAASRVLKTCLLLPPDPELFVRLQALGKTSEAWFETLDSNTRLSWILIPISLWNFRCGNYARVRELAKPLANRSAEGDALVSTVKAILAMSEWNSGEAGEARRLLADSRAAVDRRFAVPLNGGDSQRGFWHDWLFARIMVREATMLIGDNS